MGRSKKEAEQQAAHEAYVKLTEQSRPARATAPRAKKGA
jgi:dsRNA-specific ribonuclease